jgi:nucleotide-binding universal stress UspA family protein
MYKKILIPLDGSELAAKALDYIKRVALQLGDTELILFHVYSPSEQEAAAVHSAYIERAVETVTGYLQSTRPGKDTRSKKRNVNVRGELAMGNPCDQIQSFASSNDVDLILMVTHGRSGLSRLVMGSIVDKVLLNSKIPVWLLRAGATQQDMDSRLPIKTILVPLDGSRLAEAVLPYVETLAEQCRPQKVKIVLFRVCEPSLVESGYPAGRLPGINNIVSMGWEEHQRKEFIRNMAVARAYLQATRQRLEEDGFSVETEILTGCPVRKVIDYLNSNLFCVVAMATHGRSGIAKLAYGSMAEQLILHDATPLILVRPQHLDSQ